MPKECQLLPSCGEYAGCLRGKVREQGLYSGATVAYSLAWLHGLSALSVMHILAGGEQPREPKPAIAAAVSSRKDLVGNSDGVGPRLMPRNSFAAAGCDSAAPVRAIMSKRHEGLSMHRTWRHFTGSQDRCAIFRHGAARPKRRTKGSSAS